MRHDLGARGRTRGYVPLIFPKELPGERARIPSKRSASLVVMYVLHTHTQAQQNAFQIFVTEATSLIAFVLQDACDTTRQPLGAKTNEIFQRRQLDHR